MRRVVLATVKKKIFKTLYSYLQLMEITSTQRQEHEQLYQRRKLEDYFTLRQHREKLLHSLPRLSIGETDPRAKAKGVYILSTCANQSNWRAEHDLFV